MLIGKITVENDRREEVKKELEAKVQRALTEVGLIAESEAKLLCPVDTGRLRNSISNYVQAPTVYIGTNVEYAPYVEFGTSRTSAQPYLEPAVKGQLDQYRQIIEQELKG